AAPARPDLARPALLDGHRAPRAAPRRRRPDVERRDDHPADRGAPMTTAGRRTLALAGSVVAAGLSALWVVVVPDKAEATTGLQALAIRWGHPGSWALLAVLGAAVAADAPVRL